MTQRFEKAYNALYNGFMNDTLAKGSCKACAVGNIIADAMGGKVVIDNRFNHIFEIRCDVDSAFWSDVFYTADGEQIIDSSHSNQYRKKRIKKLTGYSWKEMAKIEHAFETNSTISYVQYNGYTPEQIMEDQFNGLMAVMDVMIELDNVKEGNQYKETFKNKFATVQ